MAVYDISFIAAAGGGLISFLSPCVLPLVPGYLCFLAGTTLEQYSEAGAAESRLVARTAGFAAAFVLGFSTVFVALGASASVISVFLRQNLDVLGAMASVLIMIFGLHYMGLFRIALLDQEARFKPNRIARAHRRLCHRLGLRLWLDPLHRPDSGDHTDDRGDA